jgi:hypothetical protein
MTQIHLAQNRAQLQAYIFKEHEKKCLLFKSSTLRVFASRVHGILSSATAIAYCAGNNMLYIGVGSTCDLWLKNYKYKSP